MQGNWGDQPGGGGSGQQPPGGGFGPPPGEQPAWGAPPPSDFGGGAGGGGGAPAGIDPVAIAATVVGALSLFLCWCCYLGFPLAVVALGLGIFGITRANQPGANPTSKTLSIVGIALGGLSVVLDIVSLIVGMGAGMLDGITRNM